MTDIDNFKIFVYWQNKKNSKKPKLIEKTYSIMKFKLKNIIFVTPENINTYIKQKLVNCNHIKNIAQKVDYYRSVILYENGGVWIDSDTIIIKNFDNIIKEFLDSKYEIGGATTQLNNHVVNISYLFAKKKSKIIGKWKNNCEKKILSKKKIAWSEIGAPLLGKIIINNKIDIFPINNFSYFIGYKNYEKFYSEDKQENDKILNIILDKKCCAITLYGTYMYNTEWSEKSLLNELFKL
jgi:mannosyltransferase OCH1-like enzyme